MKKHPALRGVFFLGIRIPFIDYYGRQFDGRYFSATVVPPEPQIHSTEPA
jgi:hypothetical protein